MSELHHVESFTTSHRVSVYALCVFQCLLSSDLCPFWSYNICKMKVNIYIYIYRQNFLVVLLSKLHHGTLRSGTMEAL